MKPSLSENSSGEKPRPIASRALVVMSLYCILAPCSAEQPPTNPVWNGKPLSEWLGDVKLYGGNRAPAAASNAVHNLGAKAVPLLLTLVQEAEKLAGNSGRPDELEFRLTIACAALGTNALPVVAELKRYIANSVSWNDSYACWWAIGVLSGMGPSGFQPLFEAARDSTARGGRTAVPAIQGVQSASTINPLATLPELFRLAKSADRDLAGFAHAVLRDFRGPGLISQEEACDGLSPFLNKHVEELKPELQVVFLEYLQGCARSGRTAAPAVARLTQSADFSVRSAATNTLRAIDPDLAREHGVK